MFSRSHLILCLTSFSFFLTGCSGLTMLNLFSSDSHVCTVQSVTFDDTRNLSADFYYAYNTTPCNLSNPAQSTQHASSSTRSQSKGTVVFIYGGAWKAGSKEEYRFIADSLNKQGYDVIIPDYRLFPEVAYPDFIGDIERFFTWLKSNESQYSLNDQPLFLMGHSAGAYNGAMYLTSDAYQKPFTFSAFIGLAGPYDFFLPTKDPEYIPIFTRNGEHLNQATQLPAKQKPAQLSHHLTHALILHGDNDKLVTPLNVEAFTNYLTQQGVRATGKRYPTLNHAKLVAGINNVFFMNSVVEEDIIDFLNSFQ